MEELLKTLSTLGLPLFGALLSLLCTIVSDNRKNKAERVRVLFQEKTKVYRLIAEFVIAETQNAESKYLKAYQHIPTDLLVRNMFICNSLLITMFEIFFTVRMKPFSQYCQHKLS